MFFFKQNKKIIIIVGASLGVIILCMVLYFVIFNKKDKVVQAANIDATIQNYDNRLVKVSNKSKEHFDQINNINREEMRSAWEKQYKGMYGIVYDVSKNDKDSDGDGLDDEDEFLYGTNPFNVDTDNDNYWDGHEITVGTDPLTNEVKNIKTTMIDPNVVFQFKRIEILSRLFPFSKNELTKKEVIDQDFDGIPNMIEGYETRTNGGFADTDYDGLDDYYEILLGYNPLVDDFKFTDDQKTNDSDDDYIPDSIENILGTNSKKKDTDGDGVCDQWELKLFKNPLQKDFDGDYEKLIEEGGIYTQGRTAEDAKKCIPIGIFIMK